MNNRYQTTYVHTRWLLIAMLTLLLWGISVSQASANTATSCGAVSEIPQSECSALIDFYNSTNGGGWVTKNGWNVSNSPCSWTGITCSGGHVTRIVLRQNNLGGTIPSSISGLTRLERLDLGGNLWIGGSIPASLGSLSQLNYLDLDYNNLQGSIPAELGQLTKMKHFLLYANRLSGTIPPELGNMTNVFEFVISRNDLTGSIPPELGNFGLVTLFAIYDNQLSGTIPPELGNMAALQRMYIHTNNLEGAIPEELGQLANMAQFYAFNNQLEGAIPAELCNPSGLIYLNIAYNELTSAEASCISTLQSDWANTQTIAPSGFQVSVARTETTATYNLSWTPISYTSHGGHYEISYATNAAGPYTVHGTTANKSANSYAATGLDANTNYYFKVRTITAAHNYSTVDQFYQAGNPGFPAENWAQTELQSDYTNAVSSSGAPTAVTLSSAAAGQPSDTVTPMLTRILVVTTILTMLYQGVVDAIDIH